MTLSVQANIQRNDYRLIVDYEFTQRITAITGPSGCGKSTLLNMIAGIVQPDEGKIILDERCLYDAHKGINIPLHQRKIGLVFQDSRLFPHLTVENNLRFGMKNKQANDRLNEIVSLLSLNRLKKQKPNELSGGEKQRVALGRALLSEPALLMLDEPLASLDATLKAQILPFLHKVAHEINIPMLYVSHDPKEIAHITDHVLLIQNGELKS